MKVGVIGLGYWGPNLVRNFMMQPDVEKVVACDQRVERLQFIKNKFPSAQLTENPLDVINGEVDIIVIATPVYTHHELAKRSLEAGKHIWVEKPFTSTTAEAEELIEIAEKKKLKIFVDHTFIYTGAVRKIKELVSKGELGKILYFDSERINLGLFQRDVNVVWDLAPHDLSIMNYVLGDHKIEAVSSNGIANYNGKENIAHLSIYFEDNCFAHFHVNWTSPVKIRRMIVGGDKKMLVFDDMENFEKIKVYDSGVEFKTQESIHEALVQYRIGDMFSPKVNQTEALALGAREFIDAINENRKPLTDGVDGLNVVRILEASSESLKNRGKMIYFSNSPIEV
ncbi:MAG TPA: Gfo/Idh/MocA family oxidoreductase [Ignavibacteriaceae bacterium]|nr:Gfo/Idh/MocA family oxidoreductase [Ignavibacteriaceae bacterium]